MSWNSVKISDFCIIEMGQSPSGETCNQNKQGIALLNGPTEFGTHNPVAVQWTIEAKKTCVENDLLFCVRGSTTGRMNWANQEYAIGRGLAAIRHKHGIKYKHFVKGVFDYILPELLSAATGSTFPNVSKDMLNNFIIKIPPLEEQQAIAATLSFLDDKIELNNRMNETLEEMAQAIYKQWFVDFEFPNENGEPYKSSGGAMVESEMGLIPEGWRTRKLWEVSQVRAGGDKPSNFSKFPTDVYQIPIFSNGIDKEGLFGYTDKAIICEESVTVSARGTIGFVCLRQRPYVPIVRLISVVPNKNFISNIYLYLWLDDINISGSGTTQQQLTVPTFKKTDILVSSCHVMTEFTNLINPIYLQIESNKEQTKTLTTLRNTLLPKLMTGEIRVPIKE